MEQPTEGSELTGWRASALTADVDHLERTARKRPAPGAHPSELVLANRDA